MLGPRLPLPSGPRSWIHTPPVQCRIVPGVFVTSLSCIEQGQTSPCPLDRSLVPSPGPGPVIELLLGPYVIEMYHAFHTTSLLSKCRCFSLANGSQHEKHTQPPVSPARLSPVEGNGSTRRAWAGNSRNGGTLLARFGDRVLG